MKGFFITGTDTKVGKTEIAVYLVKRFSQEGLKVGVMKPIETGVSGVSRDAYILKRASCSKDPMHHINPVLFRLALAPMVAAKIEKKKIGMGVIWDRFKKLSKDNDILIVEGIGGIMVPIYKAGRKIFYVLDMILKMGLPVIIVSRPNLGTINHTLMTVNMLRKENIKIAGIIFNHTSRTKKDLSIKTNPWIMERLSGVRVLGIMHYNRNRDKRRIRWLRKIEF